MDKLIVFLIRFANFIVKSLFLGIKVTANNNIVAAKKIESEIIKNYIEKSQNLETLKNQLQDNLVKLADLKMSIYKSITEEKHFNVFFDNENIKLLLENTNINLFDNRLMLAINCKPDIKIKNYLILWLLSELELDKILNSEFVLSSEIIKDEDFIMDINTEKALNNLEEYKYKTEKIYIKMDNLVAILKGYIEEVTKLIEKINQVYLKLKENSVEIDKETIKSEEIIILLKDLKIIFSKILLLPDKELSLS